MIMIYKNPHTIKRPRKLFQIFIVAIHPYESCSEELFFQNGGKVDAIARAKRKMSEAMKELEDHEALQQDMGKSYLKDGYDKPDPKINVREVHTLQPAGVEGSLKKRKPFFQE